MPEYKAPTPARCPHAASCWMGGGSYACVKTPPFCDEPLIPKDNDHEEPVAVLMVVGTELERDEIERRIVPIESAIKQGELFC